VKIVVDSYAWIEIFLGSATGDEARKCMTEAEEVFTPDTVLAEVARKYHGEGMTDSTIRTRLALILEASEVLRIDEEVALAAGKAYRELESKARKEKVRKPSLFDAIVLADARIQNAKVLTGDQHFAGLPETLWLEKTTQKGGKLVVEPLPDPTDLALNSKKSARTSARELGVPHKELI
jgi:predicted nucleic acid-binding protein